MTGNRMVGFGYKMGWLAIREGELLSVLAVLGARPVGPVDVAELSAALDRQVQLFVTHRVVELHRWERARDGVTVRSFEYLGEVGAIQRWHGSPEAAELAIGMPPTPAGGVSVDEDDVMRVAAAWSVDPTALDGQPATSDLDLARLPVSAVGPSPRPSAGGR